MTQATTAIVESSSLYSSPGEDAAYRGLERSVRLAFHGLDESVPLFTTDAEGLYDAFLAELPGDRRAHYACRACRSFVERFGGLVQVDEAGTARSPFWDEAFAPNLFDGSIRALRRLVARAKVTGIFFSEVAVLGLPSNASPKASTGWWHHMHTVLPPAMVRPPHPLMNASQAMAERKQDYGMLCHALADFPIAIAKQAHTLLTTGGLFRSEKCEGVAKWLLDLHEARAATKDRMARENLVWRAVASAPPGYCHVRSTMIGTLLEDIAAGKAFDDIKRAFDAKMNPLQYQRPQAAPTEGQLAAAEKVIAKLASSGALARRYAKIEDVLPRALWTPRPLEELLRSDARRTPRGEVFGHLRSKKTAAPLVTPPAQTMTWEKFARTVLPTAEAIDFLTPRAPAAFFAFVTAADPAAPPILQWDREDARNPVSWYVYHGGSMPSLWGLNEGAWCPVTAIALQPSSWGGALAHHGDGVYAILQGARDTREAGLGLFPENLRSEYHGIRVAIEAYSRAGSILGREEATACGIAMQKSSAGTWNQTYRVTSRGTVLSFRIDRWD